METVDELLILEAQIQFARKIARCYEEQDQTDNPAYTELVELIDTLEDKLNLGRQGKLGHSL